MGRPAEAKAFNTFLKIVNAMTPDRIFPPVRLQPLYGRNPSKRNFHSPSSQAKFAVFQSPVFA